MYQGPTGHRTTSFSVLDILDPNKFTSRRKQQLDAHGAEKPRGLRRELEAGMEPCSKEEYQSESGLGLSHLSFYHHFCSFDFLNQCYFAIILVLWFTLYFHYWNIEMLGLFKYIYIYHRIIFCGRFWVRVF